MCPAPEIPPTASGRLAKTPFPHLLVYMLDKQLDGSVFFQAADGTEHIVNFTNGAPSKARTGWPVEHLGRVLLELGFIDEVTLDSTLALLPASGELHGQMLLSLGKIDRAQLIVGVREQLMRRMVRLFERLDEGAAYAFYAGINLLESWGGPELTPIDPLRILSSGVRARPDHPHVDPTLARLGSAPLVVRPATNELQRFGFTSDEIGVIDLMRARPTSLAEILGSGLAPELSIKLIVYILLITRNIDLGRRDQAPLGAGATPQFMASGALQHGEVEEIPSSRGAAALARVRLKTVQNKIQGASGPGADQQAPSARRHPASEPDPTPPPMMIADVLGDSAAPPPPPARHPAPPPPPPVAQARPAPAATKPAAPAAPAAPGAPKPASALSAIIGGDPKTNAWRDSIVKRAEVIDKEDYFVVLGVPRDCTQAALQAAYFALAKQWHPDRLPVELNDVKEIASKCFARMSEAFQTLNDIGKRNEYVKKLQETASPEEQEKVARIVEAALDFQKAEVFFKKRDMVQAEHYVKKALDGDSEQAEYLALFAWITAENREKAGNKDFAEPLRQLNAAIDREPRCERAYFYRAMLYKRQGRLEVAVRDFKKAMELNPRNVDAAREVRLYEMRGGKPEPESPKSGSKDSGKPGGKPGGGGFLGKLFKR